MELTVLDRREGQNEKREKETECGVVVESFTTRHDGQVV